MTHTDYFAERMSDGTWAVLSERRQHFYEPPIPGSTRVEVLGLLSGHAAHVEVEHRRLLGL